MKIEALALLSLLSLGIACGDPSSELEAVNEDQILGESGGQCSSTAGLVQAGAPASCEPDGNSSLADEMRRVPGLGFMDGVSCDAWPEYVGFGSVAALMPQIPINTTSQDAHWTNQMLGALDIASAIGFGSSRQLTVRNVPWSSGEQQSGTMPIAYDLERGYGMVLDHHLSCSRQDEEHDYCEIRSGTIDGKPVDILVRKTSHDPFKPTVLLTAPRIFFPEDLSLDINLIVVADVVEGMERLKPNPSGGRSGPGTVGVTIEVHPGGVTIGPDWKAALLAGHEKPILAVFAGALAGIEELKTNTLAPVHKLRIVTPTMPLVPAVQSSSDEHLLEASYRLAMPYTITFNQTRSTETSAFGSGHLRKTINRAQSSVTLAAPPAIRVQRSPGGVTQLGTGTAPAEEPVVQAFGGAPVAVEWTKPELAAYAAALAPEIQPPEGCSGLAIDPNNQTCIHHNSCEDDFGPCLDDPPVYWDECFADYIQECFERDDIWFTTNFGAKVTHTWSGALTTDTIAEHIAVVIGAGLDAVYPPPTGPVKLPAGDVYVRNGYARTAFASMVLSRGLYFGVLHAAAADQSLRFGVPSTRWSTLAQQSSRQVLFAETPAAYGIDERAWREAQTWGAYLDVYDPDAAVHLNALSLPFGAIASGWHPPPNAGAEAGSVLDVVDRWDGVSDVVGQLNDAVDQQIDTALLADLSGILQGQLQATKDAADALSDAAQTNAVAQQEATERLEEVVTEVLEIKNTFESTMVSVWECPDGFASCPVAMVTATQELANSCPNANSLAAMLDIVSSMASVLGVFGSAVGAISTVITEAVKVEEAIAEAATLAATAAANLQKLKQGLAVLKTIKTTISHAQSGLKAFVGLVKTTSKLFDDAVEECDGTPLETQIRQLRTDIGLIEGLLASMGAELGILDGVIGSIGANIDYLLSSAQATQGLSNTSEELIEDLDAVQSNVLSQFERQRQFIRAACETTRVVSRTALTDLYAVGNTLSTSAGRTRTSPRLTVPSDPGHGRGGDADDRSDGFLMSLWDEPRFAQLLTEDGGGVSDPYLEDARDRFDTHVAQEICRAQGGGTLPKQRWVVEKRLTGAALASFMQDGQVAFELTLDDLIRGGNNSGSNLSALQSIPATNVPVPLAGAVVLGVGYSACTGPADDPCCPGCRVDLEVDAPFVLPRQLVVPTTECAGDQVFVEATESIDGIEGPISTCLASVHTHPVSAELSYFDADLADPALLQDLVEEPICLVDPDALALYQTRGLPVLGTWSIAYNGVAAASLLSDLTAAPNTVPSAEWSAANAGITGLDIRFFVGAEGLGFSATPAYAVE